MKRLIFIVMIIALLGGCTKRAWYEGFQAGQNHQCSRLDGESREKCLKSMSNMSYEEYNRYRENKQ